MRKTFWIILAVIALAISAPGSLADTFTSFLDTGNSAISGFTGPFGIVSVDLTSGTMATITFTAQSGFLFGATGAVDVNINATSWTISDLVGMALAGFSVGPLTNGGSGNVDGFGTLNQTFNEFDGFTNALTEVSFDVTNTSGTWANAASVLTGNSDGFDAGAHIFVCSNTDMTAEASCFASNGAIATGFAAKSTGTISTPEPSSLLLLGAGTLALAGLRKMSASAA